MYLLILQYSYNISCLTMEILLYSASYYISHSGGIHWAISPSNMVLFPSRACRFVHVIYAVRMHSGCPEFIKNCTHGSLHTKRLK